MRVLKIILVMWMGWPSAAGACSCSEKAPYYFLNTIARSSAPPYAVVPENAKGILFFSDIYHQDMGYIDTAKSRIDSVPPAVTAAQFSIVDAQTGRSVQPIVTRLNIDRQIGMGEGQRFYRSPYLGIFNSVQEVTADVKKAYGLFRVGPVGGFRLGRRYLFTYLPNSRGKRSLQTEVRIWPAIALPSATGDGLSSQGQVTAKMISMPEQGRCGEATATLVQELNYTVPASLAPYRNALLFFTQKKARFAEDGKKPALTNSHYESYLCARTPAGHSEVGSLKDLAVTRCDRNGKKWEDRLVNGYVAMLEIEDTLHETATYTIPLERSARALCAALGASNGG